MREKTRTDTLETTTELVKRLLAVPKAEMEAQERNWKRAKRRPIKAKRARI